MSGTPDYLTHMGGVPVGMEELQPAEVRWAYTDATAAPYQNLQKSLDRTHLHTGIEAAHDACTGGRNDVVFVTPEDHTFTSTTGLCTWSKSNTHLIGMHSGSRWANNCKITHTSALSINNMMTVTGSDNIFKNLHFQHGVGSQAANLTALLNTGSGNLYENCWFEGPCDNSVADLNTGILVAVGGGGNVFRNCVFGSTSVVRSGSHCFVGFKNACYRTTFENCIFYSSIDATAPAFLFAGVSGTYIPSGPQFFRNCQFVAWHSAHSTKALALFKVGAQGIGSAMWVFDQNCAAYGVSDIVPHSNQESQVYWGHSAVQYAYTSGTPDNLITGLAQNPNVA